MSSTDTKVGSPPMVSLRPDLAMSRSIASPTPSNAVHCASLYGLVVRGVSRTRLTFMS
jgi:hypothetical protein